MASGESRRSEAGAPRRRGRRALWILGVGAGAVVAFLAIAVWTGAQGPWRGQIVEAGTARPIEGVAVMFYWLRYTTTLAGPGGAKYDGGTEVLTGPDGRFVIDAHSSFTWHPLKYVSGPAVVIYKPGYGRWRFQGSETWSRDPMVRQRQADETWARFRGPGVVIHLPRVETKPERLEMLRNTGWSLVPHNRTQHLNALIEQERKFLGLGLH